MPGHSYAQIHTSNLASRPEEGSFPFRRRPATSPRTTMADKRDQVDWNDRNAIWSRIPSAKSAITRACTMIDKLVERKFVFDTPAACSDARKRVVNAYDFCVKLHDRWSNLETEAGTETASERAEVSLKPYEEKQHATLTKLNEYIANNSSAPTMSPRAPSDEATGTTPKLSTCKLLFPTQLSKSNTPNEFRLWIAAFRSLHQQSVATQQGYLLQALD